MACFDADPPSVSCGQSVSFDGACSTHEDPLRTLVLWEWDFDGDGTPDATGQATSHAFSQLGDQPVTLEVTDDIAQSDSETQVVSILNRAPNSEAGGPYIVDLGSGLTLDGTGSSDPDAGCGDSIVRYDWQIRAGGVLQLNLPDAGPTPSVSAAQVDALGIGSFTVELTVTDSFGLTGSAATTLSIYDNRPVACFTANPNPAACNQAVAFDGGCSSHGRPDRTLVDYAWTFGDGNATSGASSTTSHAFTAFGTYTVTLTVTDNNVPARTDTDSLVEEVSLGNNSPVPNAGGPYIVDLGSGLTLDGTGSSDPDAGCGDSIIRYDWQIRAGGVLQLNLPDAGPTPSLSAAQVDALGIGSFDVRLTVTDSFGLTGSATTTLSIFDNRPFACFTANPNPAACNQAVAFDGGCSSHGRPDRTLVDYAWTFGDGNSTSGASSTTSHAFTAFGTYTVTLTVTDNNVPARTDTDSLVEEVSLGNVPPVANADGPYIADLGLGLTLDGTGSSDPDAGCGDSIVRYDWQISLGWVPVLNLPDAGPTPSLSAAQVDALGIGSFNVELTVTDSFGLTGSATTTLIIADNRPFACFTANPNPAACNQAVAFDGGCSSHGRPDRTLVDYAWTFGDGNSNSGASSTTSHAFTAFGTYTVTLTVTDDNVPARTDTDSLVEEVSLGNVPPVPDAGGPYIIDVGEDLTLDASGSSDPDSGCGDSIALYEWDLDDDGTWDISTGNAIVTVPWAQVSGLPQGTPNTLWLRLTDTFAAQTSATTTLTIADTSAPNDPTTVHSTSHTPSAWSGVDRVTVQWSGAADVGSSGLAGYSVLFDQSPTTTPDEILEVTHSSDPHAFTDDPLADGESHWFHLRTCDNASNCTATVHLGPFWIDTSVPGDPSSLASTSHATSTWSNQDQVDLEWSGADDGAGSGVGGYSVLFNTSPEGAAPVADLVWGATGSGEGELLGQDRLTLGPSGEVFVADTGNHRIQVFDAGGNFVRMWGWGVDTGAAQFEICDTTTLPCQTGIAGGGAGQFDLPRGIALDLDGNVYVADRNNNRVQKLDPSGVFVTQWGVPSPSGIAVSRGGIVYVTDPVDDQIEMYDREGSPQGQWGSTGSGDGQFEAPIDLTVGRLGHVYVLDHDHRDVQEFDAGGVFLARWGSSGTGDGEFNNPYGIASDRVGSLYVADSQNHRIQKFDADGNFLTKAGGSGSGVGELNFPRGLAVDPDFRILVADSGNDRIQRFVDPTLPDATLDVAHATDPHGFTSSPLGNGIPHWAHLRTCDQVGNCSATRHLGPFWIDTIPPTDPTLLVSPSHLLATWSNLNGINFEWQGAADTGGSELAGYSVLMDNDPTTLPDTTVDLVWSPDPYWTSVQGLLDANDHWFHLRTCDHAGSCTATLHLGPFWIDATQPFDPTDVQSSSHIIGTYSNVQTVEMTWTAATDNLSGVDGYAYSFTASSTPVCDETKDLEETVTTVSSAPLAQGSWWFHICTADNAGNWTSTVTVGPYDIDLTSPDDPSTVDSTTHDPSVWSGASQITMQWTGATDAGGAGLAGYSVLFDTSPTTVPDETLEVPQGAEPHSVGSAVVADGDEHWFHLRTCDHAGNCTSTLHVGPYWIDGTDPSDPSEVTSSSHDPGAVSNLDEIAMTWTTATDNLSGVDGYAFAFTTSSTPVCDETKDLEETATTVSSAPLAQGSWWFHICTTDNAGNWTSTASAGPYVIDLTAPTEPSSVASTTHAPSVWSDLAQITIEWSGASDTGGAGLAGYSVVFDTSPGTVPDDLLEVPQGADPHSITSDPLADGSSHWFHLRACDHAGTCSGPVHVGPFWIDSTAPADPTSLLSTTHTVSAWSAVSQVTVEWSGAADSGGASLAGYSVLFDTTPDTLPDETIDLPQGTDPHSITSPPLVDGTDHWFHLRTCDHAGSCSSTLHLGPFWIDATEPADPDTLTSTTHTEDQWSNQRTIGMEWSGATDGAGSGLAGYSVEFDTNDVAPAEPPVFLLEWGTRGSGAGEFDWSRGMAVDASGAIYVVDEGNHRIQKFDPEGAHLASWGVQGSGDGELFHPGDVAVAPDGRVYVADTGNQRIQMFDAAGAYLGQWGSAGFAEGQFTQPWALAIGPTGDVYVADSEIHRVQKFGGDGVFERLWGWGVATGAAAFEVCTASCQAGLAGGGDGQFSWPRGVAVDGAGEVLVTGYLGHRVQRFTDAGTYLSQFGSEGAGDGQLSNPLGVALDASGNVFVVERGNRRVSKFDPAGGFLARWGSQGGAPGQFEHPTGISVGPTGAIYVGDTENDRVQKFQAFTLPDEVVDVPHTADPHVATSSALTDGMSHWFHLRTCDIPGNCSAALHRGPYWIDATPPSDPGDVQSTSHAIGVPSSLNLLTMAWTVASDNLSGVDGYAVELNGSPAAACDQAKDLEEDATGLTSPALADGSWWFHVCTADNAGNWTSTVTAGPYVVDTSVPTDPTTLVSTTHTTSVWSNQSQVGVEWSGAADGGGLAGYSVLFDTSPTTLPDATIEVPHAADPHSITGSPLADGSSHWFHLRTCDLAGNCSSTLHLGPFWIDTTDPTDPTDLASTSHTPATPLNVPVVDMIWTAAADATSGVDGYSFEFLPTAVPSCDETKDLEETATGVSSPPLANGDWWFHICTVDNAGNWTSTVTEGPFVIDLTPPRALWVDSSQRTEDGRLASGERTAASITQLIVKVDEELGDPAGDSDPDDVTNPDNWLVVWSGPDGTFQTDSCGPVQGDDVESPVQTALWTVASLEAVLLLDSDVPLPEGTYRLFACGTTSLLDLAGNALDGDGNGVGGDDFVRVFRVVTSNLLLNPNFDEDLEPWVLVSPTGTEIDHSEVDQGDVPTSGSARIRNPAAPGESLALSQCVALVPGLGYQMGGALRIASTAADDPVGSVVADFFTTSDCSTGFVGSAASAPVRGDTAGAWVGIEAAFTSPGDVAAATLTLVLDTPASPEFVAHFDVVYLRGTIVIFADGFETGDTSAWSNTVP